MEVINLATIAVAVLLAVYFYLKNKLTYWKKRGVPYVEPDFYYGNIKKIVKAEQTFGQTFRDLYRIFRDRGAKYAGIYMFFTPVFFPIDPELVKRILQNDFDHFVNHGMYYNEEADPLSGHLFNLEDGRWKELRAKLSPTFTSGKLKMMFGTLLSCSDELEKIINDHAVAREVVEIKDLLARFTTDIIGSCAFGLDCNSLKNPDSEFRRLGRKMFEPTFVDRARLLATFLIPRDILTKIRFRTTNKDIETFFMGIVKDTVDYREKNNIFRKDFMHLLLQLKNKGKITDDESVIDNNIKNQQFLSMNEISAQCLIFFGGGFETSSTTMTFALYELAENQNIQDKLRQEIRSVLKRHDNRITYDSIMEITYLDKVINETLRLHPPLTGILRLCKKAYPVPGADLVIEPGTRLHIPIYELHTDPEYYPNPEVFDPERFSKENEAKRPPMTFIPFGEGPRMCIGMRFGMMQTKVGLVRIIKSYRVALNEKTKTPLEMEPTAFVLTTNNGIWLNVSKVN